MSEQETPKTVKEESVTVAPTPEPDFFINKLNDMSNQITFANYNKLISLREYTTEDGTVYTARLLKPKEIGALRTLVNEVEKIDKEAEWDKYLANMEKQAELLIKDFNQDKFDNCDFYLLENLIVAWRMTYRGFRNL
jgi:hypothetical protein